MPDPTLQLFQCRPYKVRLLPKACARRHDIARTTGRTTSAHIGVRLCFGCEVGAAHAAGEAGADLIEVEAKVSGIEPDGPRLRAPSMAPRETHRVCPCGTKFKLTNRSMVYCDGNCPSRPKKVSGSAPCRACMKPMTRVNDGRRKYCLGCRPQRPVRTW